MLFKFLNFSLFIKLHEFLSYRNSYTKIYICYTSYQTNQVISINKINFETQIIAKNFIHFPYIDSTNSFIKRNIRNLNNGFVAFSTNQIAGYGTKNRIWQNFENKNLAISILFKNIDQNFLKNSTKLGAIAVIETLQILKIENAKIKWFNDILINNKKVAGILGESQIEHNKINCILGLGINLLQNKNDFKEKNLPFAGSIFSQTQKILTPPIFLKIFLQTLDKLLLKIKMSHKTNFIHTTYIENCCSIGKHLKIICNKTQKFFYATSIKILENSNLIVKINNNCFMELSPSEFSIF